MIAPVPSSSMLVSDYFEQVYKPERLLETSGKGDSVLVWNLHAFERWLGRQATLDDLNESNLQGYLTWTVSTPKSPVTANGTVKRLMTLVRYAKRRKVISGDLPDINYRKVPKRLPKAWTLEEMAKIVTASRETRGVIRGVPWAKWWPSFILTMYDTALRLSACLAIKFDEIDFSRKLLFVPGERMKNGVPQYFTLSDQTIEAIHLTMPPARPDVFSVAIRRQEAARKAVSPHPAKGRLAEWAKGFVPQDSPHVRIAHCSERIRGSSH